MKRSTLDRIQESLRLQQVYNVFLRYGWELLVFDHWKSLGDLHYAMQAWVWDLPRDREPVEAPAKVRLMLQELGPTYVKMGQIASSQASMIPAIWEVELTKLQSDVPPFPTEQARQVIFEELKAPPEELYASFQPKPFAAASTAQVHRATLHDGTPVAVKVQRPNIRTKMKADIGIMQNAVKVMASRSDFIKSIDLEGMMEQFGGSMLIELDYGAEAYNALRLAKGLESVPGVHIPKVYSELSTSRVLTLEFIPGVKASNVAAIERAGLDRAALGLNALRAVFKMVLIDGFFHADPHPGNILVNLKTGLMTFIDTGMVGELELQQRLNLVQLMVAVQQKNVSGMGMVMRNLSVPFVQHVDEKAYMRAFERNVGRYMFGDAGISFSEAVNVALETLRDNGLRLNPNLTMAIKALIQAEQITTTLSPECEVVVEGVQMVQEMALEAITADRIIEEAKKQVMLTAGEFIKRLPNLSEATIKWLDQYQRGRFELYLDTSELSKSVDKFNKWGRQVVVAIMLTGMVIGSAIAVAAVGLTNATGLMAERMSQLAYFGYIFAMIVAAIVVIRLVWRWMRGKEADED
jgi:ubiquinone biosynthesis protein